MAAPEYMNNLRKSSQLGFGVYSWLQLVDLVSRHDMSEVYETYSSENMACSVVNPERLFRVIAVKKHS